MTNRILRKQIKKYNNALRVMTKKRNEAEKYLREFKELKYNKEFFTEYDLVEEKFRKLDEKIDKILKEKKEILLRGAYVQVLY